MIVMNKEQICKAQHINHICIAVKDIDASMQFYKQMFGVNPGNVEAVSYTHLTLPTILLV